jgi:hypothetical protein
VQLDVPLILRAPLNLAAFAVTHHQAVSRYDRWTKLTVAGFAWLGDESAIREIRHGMPQSHAF